MAVCFMLLPHNPYRLPPQYKRHVCGLSCSCKHRFLWISPIFEHWFCLQYTGTVRHWQHFWSTIFVRFIGQYWCFNPQWTAGQVINKGKLCLEQHRSLKELRSCYVWAYKSGVWEVEGRPFCLHRETLTFMGPAAYQNTAVFQIGVNKIPPNFDTLRCL
jgi:hypothetical protein